jgi:inner membrane protein
MDTLTHAISGAVLGRATTGIGGSPLQARRRMGVGFLAAAFPDIDFALRLVVDPLTFLNLHRGVTHSLLLLPLWALLLAWIFALFFRDSRPRDFFVLAALAIAIHIAADVITTFGTMIFAPFSDYKAKVPTTFIIDPWFTGILLAGLAGSWIWRSSRAPATFSLIVLAAYVGFQGYLLHTATQLGRQYARDQNLAATRVTAMPQPLSPFNWRIIVEVEEIYHAAAVNLRRKEAPPSAPEEGFIRRLLASYRPPEDLRWEIYRQFGAPEQRPLALAAWNSQAMADYRKFAEFPQLFGIDQMNSHTCAWFLDLRFIIGDPSLMERAPFRFGACRSLDDDQWQPYRYEDSPELVSE